MTKRRKLVLSSIFLTLGVFATQLVDISWRYQAISFLGIITYFLTALVLKPDLKKIGWLVVLAPPTYFVIFAGLFYFLLPQAILTRALILILFAVGIYASLLTGNIFSIGTLYTIQLLRAAQAVGFLITLTTAFFGFNTIFSFKLLGWINGFLVFLFATPLIISGLWSTILEERFTSRLLSHGLFLSFLTAQMAFFVSFWPLSITNIALFLVSFLYVNMGIVQNHLAGKLFKNNLREFIQVGIIIFIITLLLARWG